MTIDTKTAKDYFDFGNSCRRQHMWLEATEAYRQALDIDPYDEKIHNNLGVALEHCGRLVEATESYKLAIYHEPGYVDAYSNLTRVLEARIKGENNVSIH